jgi:hypothetical protein
MGVLYYDAGIPGIELQPNTAATATSTGATTYDQAGATWVQIENLAILSAGGGTADTYGIKNRVVAYLTNVYVRGFLGHGVFTTALGGGSPYDDEIYGNADQSIYTNVHATSCGQHGFYTTGGDSNVILFNSCNASANGGWGFYDHSLLGNMYLNCHTTSNTLGSYKNTSAVGSSTYIGCYIEGSSLTDLSAACAWYNGQGGSVSLHPAGSPAYIQGGGANSFGAPLIHYNNQGATQVSFQMGVRGSGLAAWAWGDNSDTPTAASFQMVLGKAGSNAWSVDWWNLIRGGSARLVQYPKASVGARADAPSFPNGLFLGVAATGPRIFYGTAAPGSGTWALGDIVWNSTPSVGATMYWRCTVAGSPGTWEAVSLLSASPTVGVGYTTGAGGTVTQSTSKSTGVTLNKVCGSITMNGAALAATTAVSFTLTNSTIAADDNVIVRVKSGYATAATYRAWAEGNASGSRTIILENISAGSLSEAVVLGFTVVKSASS